MTSALLAAISHPATAQVKVWQGVISLPTYAEGAPDPNPPFDQLATSRFNYPYTLRTNLTDRRVLQTWRAIFLENEYLKCTILPDLGGHLYTCIDKINGRSMFYDNSSIKKANIGYRGAWAAFGVEYNFPVSHNWASLSPIDFAFGRKPDGSAAVTVGNVDRVYGMQWSVEMLLHPHSTVLEQRVLLNSRSDVRHRFYWWNNAAVRVWDDSQIEYPMRFAASHGFTEVQRWPVDSNGKDLSIIRNQTDGPVSLFVHGSREPFMGVWNPRTNSGTVHFANYDELPGKKTWSWGSDADALDWRKALSDDNSAYVEVQGGLFRNQETYAFLEPRQTIRFTEYWMPARDIGGITRANLDGILSLKREGGTLSIGFNANHAVRGASVSVFDGSNRIWTGSVDLVPAKTWTNTIALANPARKYTVEIRDPTGSVIMRQTEDEYDWSPSSEIKVGPQDAHHVPAAEVRSEDDWIQLGENQELNGKLLSALETYRQSLQKFPTSYAALKASGRLDVSLLHFDDAARVLETVHQRNTTDAEAAYYLGIAYDGLGLDPKSRAAFEAAYRLPEWRAAAALRLAELSARNADFRQAEHYLKESLKSEPDDIRSAEELVNVKRALGDKDFRTVAQEWLGRFPLSYMLRDVLGISDLQQLGNDPARILGLAGEYMRLGLYQNALDALSRDYPAPQSAESEPGEPSAARNPMIAYFRGYCRSKLGQSGSADYAQAASLPTTYIFPSSDEDLLVLKRVLKDNPNDASAHYLLATLDFSRGFTDEALTEWSEAKKLNPMIPVLDASMGIAQLHEKNAPEQAWAAFRGGIHEDPGNMANYLGADQALSILKRSSRERADALGLYPDAAKMPTELIFELALNLAESGDFDRAIALFRGRFFPREEGGTNVRQVWIEVQMKRTLALAKAGHCDQAVTAAERLGSPQAGFSFTADGMGPFVNSARNDYLIGTMEAGCQHTQESSSRFQSATQKTSAGEIIWAWLSAKKLPGFDEGQWTGKLESAIQQSNAMSETSAFAGWWVYNAALLNRALGREQEAQTGFHKALLLPDRLLSYHLTREALSETDASANPR